MKSIKKPVFFIIAAFILVFSYLTAFGISTYYGDNRTVWIKSLNDIRWGIDIRGGVDVTFTPPADYRGEITRAEIDAAESIIKARLISKNITDHEVYTDYASHRIIVRFPWQSSDSAFDPEEAVKELGETALLTFYEGQEQTNGMLVLTGADVVRASAQYNPQTNEYYVALELNDAGKEKFSETTQRLVATQGVISIWMDDEWLSAPTVRAHIPDGNATISGGYTREEVIDLANKINGGALPYALVTDSFSVIDPTLGTGARDAMAIAGLIAFVLMCIFMVFRYKLLGLIAALGLTGQVFGTLAVISGFVGVFDSFTLTIPGIAGIILSIGMGVDANVITAERIKEEVRSGKSLDGSFQSGYSRAFSAIFDGNITMVIVAFILMGAFGTPGTLANTLLSPIFRWFGPSAAGAIYAFGYTLIVGVVFNFIFGVFGARLMTYSLSKFKSLRKPSLYGGYPEGVTPEKPGKPYDAVENRRKFLAAPIAVITMGIVLMFAIGPEVAIEFRGGTILNYTYTGVIDENAVKSAVEAYSAEHGAGAVTIRKGSAFGSDLENITIEFSSRQGLTAEVQYGLTQKLIADFEENNLATAGSQDVNPTMGNRFFAKCLVAVLFSFAVLMLYVAFRFKSISGWSAGAFAIVALLINAGIVFSCFVFFRFPIDANFIAVILTILCYSINDTIVVFDRIRENRILHGKKLSNSDLVNMSVRQSFSRSLTTTITTCIALATISIVALVTGIGSMLAFSLPLLIGLVFGFFTSLYIAGPLWATWQNSKDKGTKKIVLSD